MSNKNSFNINEELKKFDETINLFSQNNNNNNNNINNNNKNEINFIENNINNSNQLQQSNYEYQNQLLLKENEFLKKNLNEIKEK